MWWEILELTADADQKAIKQAYARKLKQTRPDDDPEGFKVLHDAYKQALAWSSYQEFIDHDEDEDEQSTEQALQPSENLTEHIIEPKTALELTRSVPPTLSLETEPTPYQPLVLQTAEQEAMPVITQANTSEPDATPSLILHPLEPPEQQAQLAPVWNQEVSAFEVDWQHFQQQFSINIHNETARKNPKDWVFLEQLPSFIDLEFRERLSHELFGFISESNLKAGEQKTLFIKPPVLQYLNQLFAWDQQWRYFTTAFGEQQADAILLHLDTNPRTQTKLRVQPEELYYYSRFMAFLIDLALVFVLVDLPSLAFMQFTKDEIKLDQLFFVGLLVWLLAYPLVEASPWQASVGKRLMKLRVVNKQGQTLGLAHAYLRHLVTNACILGFKIVVWINLLLAYKRNMLLQDWLTHSYVVKRT
ncbi:MAG: hypothetical protein RLZZ215_803 [Pseudomonadota bacterium]|jgi:uncharacterized RDD family membrane protein YckC